MITIVAKSARTLHTNISHRYTSRYARGVAQLRFTNYEVKMSAVDVHDNDKENDEDHDDEEEDHKLLSGKKMAFYKALTL